MDSVGVSARVDGTNGTFSLPNVSLYAGENPLLVTVTDISGNQSTETRTVTKSVTGCPEYFLYDGNGNLTNWVNGSQNWQYDWDWADRLVKVSSNGVAVLENWYDASSRRIAKQEVIGAQTKKWLYLSDGWNIIGVMNENGQLLETFTRGVGLAGDIGTLVAVTHHAGSTTNGTFYAHHNHRGDVNVTRSGTSTTGTYDYTAFGALRAQTGTDVCRFKFSSKEKESTCGFSYYGFRFYSSQWQRWPNRDPLGEAGFEVLRNRGSNPLGDGANRYLFVKNYPVNRIDPFGLDSPGCDFAILPNSPAVLECCAIHDECFALNGCTSRSWWTCAFRWSWPCAGCNAAVTGCLIDAPNTPDDPGQENFYCGQCRVYFDVPNNDLSNPETNPHFGHTTNRRR